MNTHNVDPSAVGVTLEGNQAYEKIRKKLAKTKKIKTKKIKKDLML